MAIEVVDSIIARLELQYQQYVDGYAKVTAARDRDTKSLLANAAAHKTADAALAGSKAGRGGAGDPDIAAARRVRASKTATDAEKADAKAAADAVRQAARDKAAAEKAAARAAADAVKAAEREKQAALKATQREQDRAARAAAVKAEAEKVAAAAAVAAAEREAAARARLAEVVNRAVERSGPIPQAVGGRIGSTVPREATGQRGIPSDLLNGSAPRAVAAGEVAAQAEVNHVLLDRTDLQRRLQVATAAEGVEIRSQLDDLRRWSAYKRAGLTDEEALLRVERESAVIEAGRARQAAARAQVMQKQISNNADKVAGKVSLLAPTLIGGIGIAEISHLNDKYIELGNSLRIAGVGVSEFDTVQARLLKTSVSTGTSINALADVFRSASLASHDLGASQTDILRITDAVGNALRIQGVSATQAQGALLQLGHAFESGRVTAREFNSLSLNLYPILQAVAAGSDKYGGSVAKLRSELVSTGVSSRDFFQALLSGADTLEARAAKATLTTAQGFTALNNALIVYFGQADQAQGVSAAFGTALGTLAKNLDTVIPAIAAIGTALTVGYISRMVAAAAATQGLQSAALAAFGGPVGIAITAITLSVAGFAIEANNAADNADKAHQSLLQLRDQFGYAGKGAHDAAGGVKQVGTDALGAIPHVDRFAGAVGNLADQLYRQARAARVAQIETFNARIADSQQKELAYGSQTTAGRSAAADDARAAAGKGNILAFVRGAFSDARGTIGYFLSGGENDRNAARAYNDQVRSTRILQRQRDLLIRQPITASDLPGGGVGGASLANQKAVARLQAKIDGLEKIAAQQTGKQRDATEARLARSRQQLAYLNQGIDPAAAAAGVSGGRSGPSAETLARRAEAARLRGVRREDAYDAEVQSLNSAILSAKGRQAQGIEQQYQAAIANVEAEAKERDVKYQNLENEGKIDDAKRRYLVELSKQVTAQQRLTAATERANALAEQALQGQADSASNRADALRARADVTISRRRRLALEEQAIGEEFTARRINLARQIQSAGATNQDTTGLEGQLANLPYQEAAARFQAQQNSRSPLGQYRDTIPRTADQINEALDSVKARGLASFDDALTDSISKVFKLGGAFGSVTDGIINDLVRIAVQRTIVAPLADSLFGKEGGAGGGLGGLIRGIGSALHIGGARASGGNVVGGNSYLVGERGPEIVNFGASGRVYPNGALPSIASSRQSVIVVQPIHADFSGARTDEQTMRQFMDYADQRSAQAYREAVGTAGAQVPSILGQYTTLKR